MCFAWNKRKKQKLETYKTQNNAFNIFLGQKISEVGKTYFVEFLNHCEHVAKEMAKKYHNFNDINQVEATSAAFLYFKLQV